ncbi:MAG: hypothetical protein ACRD96_22465 [Bryobacteraceae bacterium]
MFDLRAETRDLGLVEGLLAVWDSMIELVLQVEEDVRVPSLLTDERVQVLQRAGQIVCNGVSGLSKQISPGTAARVKGSLS